MKREDYEKHKPFAGEKKPSMLRRRLDHDYESRRIYLITMTVEGRRPLLGRLVGNADAPEGSLDEPRVELSQLGEEVQRCWLSIPDFYPEVKPLALQLMPDHLHGILFVTRQMEQHLGLVLKGFKTGCNKAYRQLFRAATMLPQRDTGFLFSRNYNDHILEGDGELERWMKYLRDNPRRLAMKRSRPEFLRVKENVNICGRLCSSVGNLALLSAPRKLRVRISRSMDPALLEQEKARLLAAAREGAVLVSPAISPGEKQITRAAFDEGLPLIILLENGLHPLSKPGPERFRACSEGRLLLLSPFPHHNERITITRAACEALNGLSWDISGGK